MDPSIRTGVSCGSAAGASRWPTVGGRKRGRQEEESTSVRNTCARQDGDPVSPTGRCGNVFDLGELILINQRMDNFHSKYFKYVQDHLDKIGIDPLITEWMLETVSIIPFYALSYVAIRNMHPEYDEEWGEEYVAAMGSNAFVLQFNSSYFLRELIGGLKDIIHAELPETFSPKITIEGQSLTAVVIPKKLPLVVSVRAEANLPTVAIRSQKIALLFFGPIVTHLRRSFSTSFDASIIRCQLYTSIISKLRRREMFDSAFFVESVAIASIPYFFDKKHTSLRDIVDVDNAGLIRLLSDAVSTLSTSHIPWDSIKTGVLHVVWKMLVYSLTTNQINRSYNVFKRSYFYVEFSSDRSKETATALLHIMKDLYTSHIDLSEEASKEVAGCVIKHLGEILGNFDHIRAFLIEFEKEGSPLDQSKKYLLGALRLELSRIESFI